MKIYLVVENIDLGYQVKQAHTSKTKAENECKWLTRKHYDHCVENEMLGGNDEDVAEANVDEWFNWNYYEVKEVELEND
jgi:hypothetical protein